MSRNVQLPLSGRDYSQENWNLLMRLLKAEGEQRATKIVLTDLRQGDSGLEPGTLFLDGNRVLASRRDRAVPAGFEIKSFLGDVEFSQS